MQYSRAAGDGENGRLTVVSTVAIQATDRLIDQIVYQLYGLTDEEITIVEG